MSKKKLSKDFGLSTMPGLALREKYLTKKNKPFTVREGKKAALQKSLKKSEYNHFQTEQDVDKYLSHGNFALLTGHKKDILSPDESNRQHSDLIADLEASGHRWQHVGGKWLGNEAEPSVMVHDISPEEASNLARKYSQQAHIQSKGGFHKELSHDEKHRPPEGGAGHMIGDHIEDNYSEVALPNGKKVRFQLNVGYPMAKSEEKPKKEPHPFKVGDKVKRTLSSTETRKGTVTAVKTEQGRKHKIKVKHDDVGEKEYNKVGHGGKWDLWQHASYWEKQAEDVKKSDEYDFYEDSPEGMYSEDEPVKVTLGSGRHRQLRRHLQSLPEGKAHKKDIEKLGYDLKSLNLSHHLDGQGNLHHSKISQHIDSMPKMVFGVTHSTYGNLDESLVDQGEAQRQYESHMDRLDPSNYDIFRDNYRSDSAFEAAVDRARRDHSDNFEYDYSNDPSPYENALSEQRHSTDESKVFQLNYTPDHEKQMKDAGVYGTFQKMLQASQQSGHPVGDRTLGWVRYTSGDDGHHIDEIQSDFGQSFVKQGAAQIKQAMTPEGFNANGQVIRMSSEDAAKHLESLKAKYPDEHFNKISQILFKGKHPNEILHESFLQHLRNKGEAGKKVHIWDSKSKGEISLRSSKKDEPVHMKMTYNQMLPKMGYKSGAKYGELKTQHNPNLKGKATHHQILAKKELILVPVESIVNKKEILEKGSKNVREQKKKLFGTQGNPNPKSKFGQKQIEQQKKFAQSRYGVDVVPSKGKINQKTGQRKKGSIEGYDKPDWRSGEIESQWNPGAITHEFGHLEQMPEGRTPEEHQTIVDKEVGEAVKIGGAPTMAFRHPNEVQARAVENPLRRRMGLPALTTHVKVKEGEPERKILGSDEPAAIRYQKKGKTVDQLKAAKILSPENREKLSMVDTGELKFDPKTGWQQGKSIDARINRRARLAAKTQGAKGYFRALLNKPEKLAASEDQKLVGGKGDKKSLSSFDEKEVQMGIKVEMEHTKDEATAKEIVADHLTEDPKYYSKLKDAHLADELEKADPLAAELTSQKGVSESGIEARRADPKQKGAISHGYGRTTTPEKHLERARKYFRDTLNKLKSQPKPNLPKSEEPMEKGIDKQNKYGLSTNQSRQIRYNAEKGINKPFAMGTGGVGTSSQGYTVRGAMATVSSEGNKGQKFRQPSGGDKYDRELARQKARNTLRELKEMPKPNLPKSEKDMEKRCWEGYEPTPGKKPYSKGSCQPVKKEEKRLTFEDIRKSVLKMPVMIAGVKMPEQLHNHYHSKQVVPYDHQNREMAAKFVADVWKKNRLEGERMSARLLGIGPQGTAVDPKAKPEGTAE